MHVCFKLTAEYLKGVGRGEGMSDSVCIATKQHLANLPAPEDYVSRH